MENINGKFTEMMKKVEGLPFWKKVVIIFLTIFVVNEIVFPILAFSLFGWFFVYNSAKFHRELNKFDQAFNENFDKEEKVFKKIEKDTNTDFSKTRNSLDKLNEDRQNKFAEDFAIEQEKFDRASKKFDEHFAAWDDEVKKRIDEETAKVKPLPRIIK